MAEAPPTHGESFGLTHFWTNFKQQLWQLFKQRREFDTQIVVGLNGRMFLNDGGVDTWYTDGRAAPWLVIKIIDIHISEQVRD